MYLPFYFSSWNLSIDSSMFVCTKYASIPWFLVVWDGATYLLSLSYGVVNVNCQTVTDVAEIL
jgi:hypothetical protein